MALTRPPWASDTTSSVPVAPRSRSFRGKPSHESKDSVPATDTPSTRLQPDSSQPIAVATAVEATRPPRRHLTQVASSQMQGIARASGGPSARSAISASRVAAIAPTRSLPSLSMPIFSAILCTFLVPVPVAYISATGATSARSTRRRRSRTSSGKKLPVLSSGVLRLGVPAHVSSVRLR